MIYRQWVSIPLYVKCKLITESSLIGRNKLGIYSKSEIYKDSHLDSPFSSAYGGLSINKTKLTSFNISLLKVCFLDVTIPTGLSVQDIRKFIICN